MEMESERHGIEAETNGIRQEVHSFQELACRDFLRSR